MKEKIARSIPNILTVLRILLTPFFLIFLNVYFENKGFRWLALFLFILLFLTDLLDGKIARKYGFITNFGKILDPIADKVIVLSILFLIAFKEPPLFLCGVVIIAFREILVTLVRFYLICKKNVFIPAEMSGKVKTFSQTIFLGLYISPFALYFDFFTYINYIFFIFIIIVTVYSGIEFFLNLNKEIKENQK